MEDSIKERLKHEMMGILLVALGIFPLFKSGVLSSAWTHLSFPTPPRKVRDIHNWMGIVGSYVSSLFFQGFGFPSFLIPFVLGVFAFSFIFRWEWKYPVLKLIGWLVILLAISSLFGLMVKTSPFPSAGSSCRRVSSERSFRRILSDISIRPGATILLLVILILAFVLGTGISFISLVERLGMR